jgi:hypothetical protein
MSDRARAAVKRVELRIGAPLALELGDRVAAGVDPRLRTRRALAAEAVADVGDLLDHPHHLRVAVIGLEVRAVVRGDVGDEVGDVGVPSATYSSDGGCSPTSSSASTTARKISSLPLK